METLILIGGVLIIIGLVVLLFVLLPENLNIKIKIK